MKRPPMDSRVKRPAPYRTAVETEKPGYLARRFAQIKAEQSEQQRSASAQRVVPLRAKAK